MSYCNQSKTDGSQEVIPGSERRGKGLRFPEVLLPAEIWGRQICVQIQALSGSNCVTLSKNHKVFSEPHFHLLLNGDDNNNIPENEIEIISHLVRLVVCFVAQSCLTLRPLGM